MPHDWGSPPSSASEPLPASPLANAAGPQGNNGTVKVAPDGDIDAIPNNHPHVGCTFQLEWYGFDANVVSTVLFEEQAPTTGVGMTVAGDTTVQLDNDPGAGAGNDGIDGSQAYTLSFTGAPHPQQGYHVEAHHQHARVQRRDREAQGLLGPGLRHPASSAAAAPADHADEGELLADAAPACRGGGRAGPPTARYTGVARLHLAAPIAGDRRPAPARVHRAVVAVASSTSGAS